MEIDEREDEINLLDYWRVIIKRWRIIALIFFASVLTSAIVSLLMTPIYQAKATIMPIESSGGRLSSALRSLESLPFVGGMLPGAGGASASKLVAVLKSRTMAEDVIQALDLIKILFEEPQDEPPTLQDAVRSLSEMTKIADDKKGLISISVEYKDPGIAADIANQFTVALKKFLNENALSMAKRNRIFIEDQLKKVKEELGKAEEALKGFQINKKIVAMDAQTEASITALASLKAQLTAKQVQLGVIRQYATLSNPDVLRLKDELRELKKQLTKLESKGSNTEADAFPSLSEAPELGLQYIRLKRDAVTRQKVYELLTQQYEIAKIDEAKEDITFQVIDKAIPPEKRIKPKRKLNVMLAGVVALFAGIFLVFFLEYLGNIKKSEEEIEQGDKTIN
ncbi:MAG: lipopolysaccharide biosynthesis protein [Deltaproteobacteria bacterium]|nr:lipopolysaccharide biosynthesis protein [Deltaproteobacteria bacterium]